MTFEEISVMQPTVDSALAFSFSCKLTKSPRLQATVAQPVSNLYGNLGAGDSFWDDEDDGLERMSMHTKAKDNNVLSHYLGGDYNERELLINPTNGCVQKASINALITQWTSHESLGT
jgi:hypothetical protein